MMLWITSGTSWSLGNSVRTKRSLILFAKHTQAAVVQDYKIIAALIVMSILIGKIKSLLSCAKYESSECKMYRFKGTFYFMEAPNTY